LPAQPQHRDRRRHAAARSPCASICHQRGTPMICSASPLRNSSRSGLRGAATLPHAAGRLQHLRVRSRNALGDRQAPVDHRTYMVFLAHWARKLSWMETASSFRTSWDKVCRRWSMWSRWGLEHRSLGPIRAIGVDEIQYAKGHKLFTLVYQIEQDCTRLLWIARIARRQLRAVLRTSSANRCPKELSSVCSDMWKPYLRVVHERCHQRAEHSRSLSHRPKMNDALGRRARRRSTPARPGRLRAGPQKTVVRAKRKANLTTTHASARDCFVQPQDGASVPAQGGLPATLEYDSPTGRQIPRRAVQQPCAPASSR